MRSIKNYKEAQAILEECKIKLCLVCNLAANDEDMQKAYETLRLALNEFTTEALFLLDPATE